MRKTSALITLLVVLLFSGSGIAQKVENRDGVRYVHNGSKGSWGNNPKITLEPAGSLGSIDTDDENFMFYMPADIAFDADGNIYVLDKGNHRIQKFNQDGKYLKTIGEEGQGPGEMKLPISLDVDADGNIFVGDEGNFRIQVFMPDGKIKGTFKPEGNLMRIRLFSNGDLLMGKGEMMMMRGGFSLDTDKDKPEPLLSIVDREGKEQSKTGEAEDFENFMMNRTGNEIFYTIDNEDNYYVLFRNIDRIDRYNAQKNLEMVIHRELEFDPFMPDPDKEYIQQTGGNIRVERPQFSEISMGFDIDSRGRIWVITATREMKEEEEVNRMIEVSMDDTGSRSMNTKLTGATDNFETDMYKVEIFDTDGTLLGSIPLTHFCDCLAINGSTVYILDGLRSMQYYKYTIVEN